MEQRPVTTMPFGPFFGRPVAELPDCYLYQLVERRLWVDLAAADIDPALLDQRSAKNRRESQREECGDHFRDVTAVESAPRVSRAVRGSMKNLGPSSGSTREQPRPGPRRARASVEAARLVSYLTLSRPHLPVSCPPGPQTRLPLWRLTPHASRGIPNFLERAA
jgi:hypothetical protein